MLNRSPAYTVDLMFWHLVSFSLSERHPNRVLQTYGKSQIEEEGITWGYLVIGYYTDGQATQQFLF